eukprot:9476760-Pyramimonas_sp.AAC.4
MAERHRRWLVLSFQHPTTFVSALSYECADAAGEPVTLLRPTELYCTTVNALTPTTSTPPDPPPSKPDGEAGYPSDSAKGHRGPG